MKRGTWILLALGLLSSSASVQAQPAYPIKLKETVKGDVRQVSVTETSQSTHKVLDATNKAVIDQSMSSAQESSCVETILEKEAGKPRPTQLRRVYQTAKLQLDGKEIPLPYAGKTVEIRKKDNQFEFLIEGKTPLSGEAAAVLQKEFSKDEGFELQRAVLPSKPVQVNETWAVDMAPIIADWQKNTFMQVDATKARGVAQLVKVYQKEGRTYGELLLRMEMPLLAIGTDKDKLTLNTGSRMLMEVTLDGCIDGTSCTRTMKARFDMQTSGAVPLEEGKSGTMEVKAQGSLQEVFVEQPR